jgi:hypothetical protein
MVLDKDEDANSNNKSGLITYRDALLWFTNLDSTNGTKIARELHPPMKLSDGIKNDILICGNTKMRFQLAQRDITAALDMHR